MIFPIIANQTNGKDVNSISYTLGGKLKRNIQLLKEKFEYDISDF